jgi:hypothetical protein
MGHVLIEDFAQNRWKFGHFLRITFGHKPTCCFVGFEVLTAVSTKMTFCHKPTCCFVGFEVLTAVSTKTAIFVHVVLIVGLKLRFPVYLMSRLTSRILVEPRHEEPVDKH